MTKKRKRATATATPKNHSKDTKFATQFNTVFHSFSLQPKTMLQVAIETGILRANICRYVAKMENTGKLYIQRKGLCPISKHRAGYYTTYKEINL